MKEVQTRHIDGFEYTFSQFGAKQSLKVLIRLSKVIGKPMALAFSAAKGPGSIMEKTVDGAILAQAVEALTNNLHEDEALSLIETLAGTGSVLCDGKTFIFDSHYEGRLDHLFRVLQAALEVQYGNFTGALLAFQSQTRPPVMNQAPVT